MCEIVGVRYLVVLLSIGGHERATGGGWCIVKKTMLTLMARSKPHQSFLSVLNSRPLVGCSGRQECCTGGE